jgi:serine protease Do
MMSNSKEKIINGRQRLKRIFALGLPFFVAGLLIASGFHWTKPSLAGDYTAGPHVTASPAPVMPSSFSELASKLSPTVVNVKVTKIEKTVFQNPEMHGGQFDDFFKRFFKGRPQMPDSHRRHGAGSGVIISKDGYVLTNNHVVDSAKEVTVTLADREEFEAKVIGRDPKTDLAVLKIETNEHLPSAALGDSEGLRVGDWVVAIGNPFGLSHTVTSGIVSAKGRVIGAGPYDDFIQTDASINPGNSGGPLFNLKGEVVGINTAIIAHGQGIGFAIPVNTAKPLIPQLVSTGKITRGYLGVNIQTITSDLAKALDVEKRDGALVADVVSGSPAEKAGIQRGDIIIAYNGEKVKDSRDLPAKVAATPVNEKAAVTVLREGKEQELTVKVGRLESEEMASADTAKSSEGKWGLKLHNLDAQIGERMGIEADSGVVVVGVEPGSPAQEAGLRRGDVIIEVNRKPVDSVDDIKKNIGDAKDKDHLLLLVQRQNGKFFVPLEQQG